jgi:acyl-CoA synthetase (AMP-forming)/AMP-acid ligase II/thioesterase domain-containing protein/acyl carrier protein
MPDHAPLLAWTLHQEQTQPDALYMRYLLDGRIDRPLTRTFADLAAETRRVAAALQERTRPGDRVLMLFPPGPHFSGAFLGTTLAGCIAVPAYTPDPNRLARTLSRLRAIVADSGCTLVLTTRSVVDQAAPLLAFAEDLGALDWLAVDDLPADLGAGRSFELPSADRVAYLQYTSGSTSRPRGVMLTHANVAANMDDLFAMRMHPLRSNLSWLPVHHDMGLVMSLCAPLHAGASITLISPLDFIRRPACWLEAASHFGSDTTGAPTFGFALAARKTTDEQVAALDLSGLDTAVVSAEHVHPPAVQAFIDRFAPAGLDPAAVVPAYGLAEVTVIATAERRGQFPRTYDADALADGRVVPDPNGELHMASGGWNGTEVRIVVDGEPVDERQVGEIWLHGPSIGRGYWQNPDATEATFHARLPGDTRHWLRTGDLGFIDEGHLFVTSRAKDLIVVAGRNVHPHDVEEAVEAAHPACRKGNSAAFPWRRDGEEQVGVAVEVDPRRGELETVLVEVRRALAAHGTSPALVALLAKNTLPKTSSGKRQRRRTAERLMTGELATVARWEPTSTGTLDELLARYALDGEGDFFARGGQSIDLVRLADQLSAHFGVDVPLQTLFADPTADGVRRALQGADRLSGTVDPCIPSAAEARMRALYASAGAALHLAHVETVAGPFDPERFADAIRTVQQHHPALRTAWRATAEGLRIEGEVAPVEVETTTSFDDTFTARLTALFDLAAGPLARVVVEPTDAGARIGWILPHPVADGASAERVVVDTWRAYAGATLLPRTRQAPRPSRSHARWWADRVGDVPATRMTTDPLDVGPFVGRTSPVPVDPDAVERLLALGAEEGCTPSMTWLAWFLLAVHDWVDADELRIGTPVTRPRTVPDEVGCLVDVQLVVSRLDATSTFRTHLAAVRAHVLEAMAHPTPLADVVSALRTNGPALDVLFNHFERRLPTPDTGLVHTGHDVPPPGAALGVTLDVLEDAAGTRLRLVTADATVGPEGVPRLVAHLQDRLDAVLAAPDAPVASLPLANGVAWCGPLLDVPTGRLEGPLLDRDPDAIAVIHDGAHTVGALCDAARRVAATLVARGHQPGDAVVVDLDRSFAQIAALVGVRLADGCIVPLAPDGPSARRDRIRAEADTPFVIDDAFEPDPDAPFHPRPVRVDAIAYRLHTSGSTGRPQPVGVSVANLLHRIVGGLAVFPALTGDDRFAQKTSAGFGDALSEVWQPLWTGHPIVVLDDATVRRPAAFLAALEQHRVTRMVAVPSLLRVLVERGLRGRLPHLRVLVSSGEELPDRLAHRLLRDLPHVALFNLYGASETSLDVTAHRVDPGPVTLGEPLPNVRLRVVDRHGRPRPPGLPGELHVGGPFVSPAVPDPARVTTDADGTRWFATRDRVRRDGSRLVGLGRLSDHVKVHGIRVDCREVERHLLALPGTTAAVVRLRDGRLTAWLTGARPSVAAVRRALADQLPPAALPTVVVHLDALPLLPSGKVDAARLPAGTAPIPTTDPPQGPLERHIAACWTAVLGVDAVGRHADFYDLGGQSVAAMEVGARLEAHLGRPVPPELLLRCSTVAGLAAALADATAPLDDLVLQAEGEDPPLFLLYGVIGTTARMATVARHLHGRRRVIGLEAMSLRAGTPPHRSVESAARSLARRVEAHCPTGPVLLGGYSFGGVLAFAVARELTRRGRPVAGIYLVDSVAPVTRRGPTTLVQQLRYVRMRAAVAARRWRDRIGGDGLDASRATKDANLTAWSRYRPSSWSGPATLLRTDAPTTFQPGDWHDIAPSLRVVPIPGDHDTCVRDPLAAVLAEQLDAAIRRDLGLPPSSTPG